MANFMGKENYFIQQENINKVIGSMVRLMAKAECFIWMVEFMYLKLRVNRIILK